MSSSREGGDDEINGKDEWRYMIIRPERAGFGDLWRFWRKGDIISGSKFIKTNCCDDDEIKDYKALDIEDWRSLFDGKDNRWVIVVSVIVRKLIKFFGKPMKWFGYFVDFFLNLLSLNGNLFGLAFNAVQGKVVIPERGTTTFISTIGHLDGRIELNKSDNLGEESSNYGIEIEIKNNRALLMDLCIMASKLAYENASVVKEVVVSHWKANYQQQLSTQVFILCDKPVDANFILISFRGTEPYDADDWSTDFDYSWYDIPHIGKIHMGFLEALGLGNRTETLTFTQNLLHTKNVTVANAPEMAELTAYNAVKTKLKDLLQEHKNAEFIVTGHSLGGALAILFPTVLAIHEERAMIERLLGVYTFGQPRIGDRKLGSFMEDQLNEPELRYFRVVYCNDVVPRLPYDDKTFLYKHFGKVDEEPNKNFYGIRYLIPAYMNAAWELMRALTMSYIYGVDYKEDWYSIMLRIVGLMLPGISAHSPRDYVNSMRLGREHTIQIISLD
ncbi:Feruloyl esterase A [Bienertia sinuspersici]